MVEKEGKVDILAQYDKQEKLYADFLNYFYNTITGILDSESIVVQNIDVRLKNRKSLGKKIVLKAKYKKIDDITDICGMRIITYFSDDVDKIANFIKEEFEVDEANSVDKREIDDPTKFGYVSLHYIVSLKGSRSELPEAKRFRNLKIEIQIRTILQHAWAEIEHDLGYKAVGDIPVKVRRQFSRLASHIELADEEFVRVKESINSYSEEVRRNIKNKTEEVLIDIISVSTFVINDEQYLKTIESIDKFMPNKTKRSINDSTSKNILSKIVKICTSIKIVTIGELKTIYLSLSDDLEKCLKREVESQEIWGMSQITPLISILDIINKAKNKSINSSDFIRYYEKEQQEVWKEKYLEGREDNGYEENGE